MVAVDGGARGVYVFLDRHPYQSFEQPLSRLDIVPCIDVEIASPALSHSCLGCEVEYVSGSRECWHEVDVLDRGLDKAEVRAALDGCQIRLFQRAGVVIGKAVDARNGGTRIQ